MSYELRMPQLGESVTEGTVGSWLKKEGERVQRDEPLVEVITDKVTAEVPSPVEGVVAKILVQEGETVPVGQVIALIAQEAEAAAVSAGADGATAGAGVQASPPAQGVEADQVPVSQPVVSQSVAGPASLQVAPQANGHQPEPRRYSPVVRRLAQEHGIDLSQIQGTGFGGRVTKKDVLAFLERRAAQVTRGPVVAGPGAQAPVAAGPRPEGPVVAPVVATPASAGPVEAPVAAGPAVAAPGAGGMPEGEAGLQVLEPTAVRRTIAERMVHSWREIPHAWAMVEVDVTKLVRLRERLKDEFRRREGVPLTYVPFWIKAVVQCLREEPLLNATWQDGKIVVNQRINVGLAVGVEEGLVVPVIHDADRHSIASLAREVHRLAEAARTGRLTVADVQGGTITLNNTGALGIVLSKSILNPPQTAICNMEAIVKRPVVINDAIAIRDMVNISLSFDHRVMDGVTVGRFLRALKARMEAYDETTSLY